MSRDWQSGGYGLVRPHTGQMSRIYSNGRPYAVEIQLHAAMIAEDLNGILLCFLRPLSKRAMQLTPHAPTTSTTHHTRWAFGPALFDSSVTPSGPFSRRLVVLVASRPMSLSMPQAWVLYTHGALQPAYTTRNVSTQSPLHHLKCLSCSTCGCAEQDFRRCVDALATAWPCCATSHARPEPGGQQNARLDEGSNI